MYFDSLTLALWEPHYEDVKKIFSNEFNKAKRIQRKKTPDTKYVVISWENISGDDLDGVMKYTETVRHSLVGVDYDGGDIFVNNVTYDDDGCDGEFDYLLMWTVSVRTTL